MWSILLALACHPSEEGALAALEPQGIETRFLDAEEWTPTAQEAFAIRDRCPRIATAQLSKETEHAWLALVHGVGLEEVAHVGVHLPDGTLAHARHKLRPDGSLDFPFSATEGTVYLGLSMGQGRLAACTGPGFSLEIDQGEVVGP